MPSLVLLRCPTILSLSLACLLSASSSIALAHGGPTFDLPEEVDAPPAAPPTADRDDTPMSLTEAAALPGAVNRMGTGTTLGGYGELHFNAVTPDGGDTSTNLDLHRVVFFFGHDFGNGLRFYSELEIEHAFVEGAEGGEVALEQAFVDWDLLGRAMTLRAGMVLVPMGLMNSAHNPPTFQGVERPSVDKLIIPSTWREGGIGLVGQPTEGLRYELYLLGGLDPAGFSGSKGIRGGRQGLSNGVADGPAVTARVAYEPILGLAIGLAGYYSITGPNTDAVSSSVPVAGGALDMRVKRSGIELRAELAYLHVGDTAALRADTGSGPVSDVGSDLLGGYVEFGYDVLHSSSTRHALVPFARAEWYDTTLSESDPAFDTPSVFELTMGATYRPIFQVAFKADVQLRRPSSGRSENIIDLGVGWMF
ncbi:MAG: hypothetical protein GXP55_19470 [Deltaproteobacteria bacterium]|nr:hypothetical protein [Deltaproteobacteria bacterium]